MKILRIRTCRQAIHISFARAPCDLPAAPTAPRSVAGGGGGGVAREGGQGGREERTGQRERERDREREGEGRD